MTKPKSAAFEQRRAEHFKKSLGVAEQKVAMLAQELRTMRARVFAEGSAATMASVHAALNDDILSMWLSQRMMSCRVRRPPFNLKPETEAMVRAEVAALLEKCRIKSVRVEDISL